MTDENDNRWEQLDRLDGMRDEPAKDDDAIRAELDELEYQAGVEWLANREKDL